MCIGIVSLAVQNRAFFNIQAGGPPEVHHKLILPPPQETSLSLELQDVYIERTTFEEHINPIFFPWMSLFVDAPPTPHGKILKKGPGAEK